MPSICVMCRRERLRGRMLMLACLTFLLCLMAVPGISLAEEMRESLPASEDVGKKVEPSEALVMEQASPPVLHANSDVQSYGIPTLRLTIDPEEYRKMTESDFHEYQATGASISLDVPSSYTGEFSESELPDVENLSLEYIRGRGNSTWLLDKKPSKDEPATPKAASYFCALGNGDIWTKGSGKPQAFVFERTEDDESTFDRLAEVLVDGKKVDPSNYSIGRGSLVLTFGPEFLEGLEDGSHVVVARFDDGSARAAFLVQNETNASQNIGKLSEQTRGAGEGTTGATEVPMTAGDSSSSVQNSVAQYDTTAQAEIRTAFVSKVSSNQLPNTGDSSSSGLALYACLSGLIALAIRRQTR